MTDIVIKAENLGKKYVIGHQAEKGGYTALRDVLMQNARNLWNKTKDLVKGQPIIQGDTLEDVWALKDVCFEIRRGEAVGIIGRNGAGKSTLLKVLSRITEPSTGRITIKGRVASLLEVGTGFHPELSGRENIYLNGTILGMTRAEIKRKFDEIVAFAEVEKYLDTPVKRYSSGMYVRLAFAVAAHLEPEILVVDEVLAVGDAEFQKKCLGKMGDVAKEGRTVLFVSHNMGAIAQLCKRVLFLDQGKLISNGPANEIIEQYLNNALSSDASSAEYTFPSDPDKCIQITAMRVLRDNGEPSNVLDRGFPFKIIIEYEVRQPTENASIEFVLEKILPKHVYALFSLDTDLNPERRNLRQPGRYISTITFPQLILNVGAYNIRAWIWKSGSHEVHDEAKMSLQFHLYDSGTGKAIGIAGGREDIGLLGFPLRWDTQILT